jgi:hypothetical protein
LTSQIGWQTEVVKDKQSRWSLRCYDGTPLIFLRGDALDQAEEGGYILVGPMGDNSISAQSMPDVFKFFAINSTQLPK